MNKESTHYQIPLPHPQHDLQTDVYRLRSALEQIDSVLKRLDDRSGQDHEHLQLVSAKANSLENGSAELIVQLNQAKSDLQAFETQMNERLQAKMSAALATQNQNIDNMRALLFAAL